METPIKVYIYVLELESNKYYIGKTTNPDIRIDSHFNSNGSLWTKKYKPIKVIEIIPNCDNYDEDKYTLKYMQKFGINNVRGGSFCEFKLNNNTLATINKMILGATDKCYICGNTGHFAKECDKIINEFEELFITNIDGEVDVFENIKSCYRCGRIGHYSNECYAKKHINGKFIANAKAIGKL